MQVRVLAVDESKRRLDLTQKDDEEREMEKLVSAGPVSSKAPPPKTKKGSAGPAPGGSLASALAAVGLSVSHVAVGAMSSWCLVAAQSPSPGCAVA